MIKTVILKKVSERSLGKTLTKSGRKTAAKCVAATQFKFTKTEILN